MKVVNVQVNKLFLDQQTQIIDNFYEDINECERTPEICHENERCDNTIGSYKCVFILICEEGYELNANRTECVGK